MTQVLLLLLGGALCILATLASLRRPYLIAMLILVTMGMDYVGQLGFGFLTANNLLKALFVAIVCLRLLLDRERAALPTSLLAFMPFLLLTGASCFYSAGFLDGVAAWFRLLFIWIVSLLLANAYREEKHIRWAIHFMACVALLQAAVAITQALQLFTSGPLAIHGSDEAFRRGVRVSGTFWNPNSMAIHMAGLMILLFACYPSQRSNRKLAVLYIAGILGAQLCIILSLSRSGFIAAALALFLFLFSRRHRKLSLGFMVLGLGGLVFVLLFSPYKLDLLSRIASFASLEEDRSGQVRFHLAMSGLAIFSDGLNFIWGAGFKSFIVEIESHLFPLMSHDGYYHTGIRASHNLWITIIAEGGLIGLLAMGYFFKEIYGQISRQLRGALSPLERDLLIGIAVYVTVKLVDFNLNMHLEDNLLWYSVGLLGALAVIGKRRIDAINPIAEA